MSRVRQKNVETQIFFFTRMKLDGIPAPSTPSCNRTIKFDARRNGYSRAA